MVSLLGYRLFPRWSLGCHSALSILICTFLRDTKKDLESTER